MANGFIFVSGQTPCTLAGKALEGSFEEKVTVCCSNIKSILQQAGSDISQTVKVCNYFS
jgi:2-iminobutanoate/2-iminopropanoate deaminase